MVEVFFVEYVVGRVEETPQPPALVVVVDWVRASGGENKIYIAGLCRCVWLREISDRHKEEQERESSTWPLRRYNTQKGRYPLIEKTSK